MLQHDNDGGAKPQTKRFLSIREIRQKCGAKAHDYRPCPTPDYWTLYEGLHTDGTFDLDFGVT